MRRSSAQVRLRRSQSVGNPVEGERDSALKLNTIPS